MSNVSMTPGSRPRKGLVGVLALLGTGALAAAVAVGVGEAASSPPVAAAVALERFGSCEDLAAWGAEAMGTGDEAGWAEADVDSPTAAPAADGAARAEAGDATAATSGADGDAVADTTNVAVEGVDELDVVDRLADDVVLVAGGGVLAVVDLAAGEVVARVEMPSEVQVTYDAEAGVAWAVGASAEGGTSVTRFAASTSGLEEEGTWTTTGGLVDARRVGDALHVVATEGFTSPMPEAGIDPPAGQTATVPFADGPVACDAVLHPEGTADASATLLVTLPAEGAVEPVRSAEVVGSGSLVHVTTEAAYLATPQWDDQTGTPSTGIHRFDLATLEPTGSGRVEGSLLDDFSMSEHDDGLRVATTRSGGCCFAATPVAPADGDVGVATDDVAVAPTEGEALNEIVVLDTDGALDEVGRTERFGKPGETLHGIRFSGTTAYAVTFLQTDPFYVVDLTDPTAPAVVGEVELPGFSSYLHPLGDGLVVGFGPGADGRASAKLFDVSDPTAPVVVDDLTLGDDSAVAYDHHAFVDLGDGRFAVPATTYQPVGPMPRAVPEDGQGTDRGIEVDGLTATVLVVDTSGGRLTVEERVDVPSTYGAERAIPAGDGWALLGFGEMTLVNGDGALWATLDLAG